MFAVVMIHDIIGALGGAWLFSTPFRGGFVDSFEFVEYFFESF